MKYKFRVSYVESKEVLQKICELFNIDNSDLTMKVVDVILGVLVLVGMFVYGKPGGGTIGGVVFFLVKFVVCWALLSILTLVINRTIWRKAVIWTSVGDAEEQYVRRKARNKGNIKSQIEFYEDYFCSVTAKKKREFRYDQVVKFLETDETFGIIIKPEMETLTSTRAMIGFPKNTLENADIEELKKFLLERCPRAKKKIKKL